MNFLLYSYISLLSICFSLFNGGIDKLLISSLSHGEAKALSTKFTSTIKVSIDKEEHALSKFQAELIISDFLSSNKFVDIKKSSINNEASQYLVYNAKTDKRNMKVYIKLVSLKNENYISEIRFE